MWNFCISCYVPKLIYLLDEIDQGISSEVASKLGQKVKDFSNSIQTILISHTVQVISKMDNLYNVEKYEEKDKTISRVREIENND